MNHIAQQLSAIRQTLPEGVRLVAVSKFHPETAILEAYQAGQGSSAKAVLRNYPQKPLPSPPTSHGTS